MRQDEEQAAEIRQFLLGRLPEGRASRLEERIFADADFAEEVEITEGELIAEYRAGELVAEERAFFERQYLASAAGRRLVEYEEGLHEFIRAKAESRGDALRAGSLALAGGLSPAAATDTPAPAPEGHKSESFLSRLRSFFKARPVFAALTVAASFVFVLAAAGWYLSTLRSLRPPGSEQMLAARRKAEEVLVHLNAGAAAPPREEDVTNVDLQPLQRSGGDAMPRIPATDPARDTLLKLRLSLTQAAPADYRAVFLDDRQQELFAVSNLSARDTPDGPQVWLLVPANYFRRGDYQINLSFSKDGGYEVNSYAFRVTDGR